MSKSLDLGCAFQPKNPFNADEVFGVDIADIPNPNVRKADLVVERIPFDDDTFNFVTAHDFLEHVPRMIYMPERRNPFIEIMNESYRVMKYGGMFLSLTPAFPHTAAFQDPTHVNFITESTFPFYFDNVHRWAAGYGFKGAFQIMMQEWRGAHLLTVMQKVPVPAVDA